jgi:hypothetical protein
VHRPFIRPYWLSPIQCKKVAFTIPYLAELVITIDRQLKGPHPLRIVRTIAQHPMDPWPLDIHLYTLPRRGEREIKHIIKLFEQLSGQSHLSSRQLISQPSLFIIWYVFI